VLLIIGTRGLRSTPVLVCLPPLGVLSSDTSASRTEHDYREWRDGLWLSVPAVSGGIDPEVSAQRHTLFGANEINIESKSTVSLLVEEVKNIYKQGS
jgi:hypothetical protein